MLTTQEPGDELRSRKGLFKVNQRMVRFNFDTAVLSLKHRYLQGLESDR